MSNIAPRLEIQKAAEHELVERELLDITLGVAAALRGYKQHGMDWLRERSLPLEDGVELAMVKSDTTNNSFTSIRRYTPITNGSSMVSEWRWNHVYHTNREEQVASHLLINPIGEEVVQAIYQGYTQEETSLLTSFLRKVELGDTSADSGMFGRAVDFSEPLMAQEAIDG